MAIKFGKIKSSDVSFEEQTFHKNIKITSASIGVNQHFGLRDDYSDKDDPTIGLITTSGSQWAFIHTMFYTSGSRKYAEQNIDEVEKFNHIYDKYNEYNDLKPFYNNKFYSTASIFYIPQQYFGERIKPGTFEFTARTGSNTNTTNEIIIKDDSNGNLYSSNAHHSQSSDTALSSSDNYVGNIYYDLGIAVLTETGSWSGSAEPTADTSKHDISYMDINKKDFSELAGGSHSDTLTRDYRFWDMKFNSTTPIFTSQYSIKIPAGDLNSSMNTTTRIQVSGSLPSGSREDYYANLRAELTGSNWHPYFTQVLLYNDMDEEPVMIANLPRPVQKRNDIDLIITFRVDH
tara:strand:+ start:3799 stop:4836 length:1038 start_codon:yes stop_codon:yes gene_type:complete